MQNTPVTIHKRNPCRSHEIFLSLKNKIGYRPRTSTIADAELILVLHHGEIVERGTHAELLAQRGLYYTMYELQNGTQE